MCSIRPIASACLSFTWITIKENRPCLNFCKRSLDTGELRKLSPLLMIAIVFLGSQSYHAIIPTVSGAVQSCVKGIPPSSSFPAPATLNASIYTDMTGFGGHAFLGLLAKSSTNAWQGYCGFYPNFAHILPGGRTSKGYTESIGNVVNDALGGLHIWDWRINYTLTPQKWDAIASWINQQVATKLNYTWYLLSGLNTAPAVNGTIFNCMSWAVFAINQLAGLPVPTSTFTRVWLGSLILGYDAADPISFGKYLMIIGDGKYYSPPPLTHVALVQKNPSSTVKDPFYPGSYLLTADQGLANPMGLATAFNNTFVSGSLGSVVSLVGQPVGFTSPISLQLNRSEIVWRFGDGSARVNQTATTSHAYSTPGTFTVTFLAVNDSYVWSYAGTVSVVVPTFTLSISSSPGGTTSPAPAAYRYTVGTQVAVTAIPATCYGLGYWLLDGANSGSSNPITVTMNADHTLQSVFSLQQFTLTISATTGGTTDPMPGTYSLFCGSNVSVTATPFTNYQFDYWSFAGVNVGSNNPISITVNADGGLVAVFSSVGEGGSVGGEFVPMNKVAVVAPYIVLAFLIVAATSATAVYVRRAKLGTGKASRKRE
jgi:hypothetical protein